MRANRYVSYLATEIEPQALSTLSRFERAQEAAFNRIAKFNQTGAVRLGVNALPGTDPRTLRALTATATGLNATRVASDRTATSIRNVTNQSSLLATGLTRSAQSLTVVQGALGPLAGRLSALGNIFRDLSGISLTGVLGGGAAFALVTVASNYQRVTDRLRPFYETQQQTNKAMRDVIGIARETRQALDPVAQLYTKLSQASKDAGVSVDSVDLTSTVAKAARLSGGDAQTQQAGLTQFGQGFGAGTLNGDELKSIRENTFRLAKALADGLGVPIARLKQLGAEGKLTPVVIAEALKRSADQIDLEFSRLPIRIDQALTQAGNNLSIFVGRADEAAGATAGIAKAISLLGNNIGNTTTAMAGLLAVFTARRFAAPLNAMNAALSRRADLRGQQRQLEAQQRVPVFGPPTAAGVQPRAPAPAFTPLTPTGIARAKADTALDRAQSNLTGARAEQTARLGTAASIKAEADQLKQKQVALLGESRTAEQAARANLELANARLQAAAAGVGVTRTLAQQQATAAGDQARAAVTAARARVYAADQALLVARANGAAIAEADRQAQMRMLAQNEAGAAARVRVAREEAAATALARNAASQRVSAATNTITRVSADPTLSRANRGRQIDTATKAQALAEREVAAASAANAAATRQLAIAQEQLNAARRASRAGVVGAGVTQAETAATAALAAAKQELAVASGTLNNALRSTGAASAATAGASQRLASAQVAQAAAARALANATREANAAGAAAQVTGFKRLSVVQRQVLAEVAHRESVAATARALMALRLAEINATASAAAHAAATANMTIAQRLATVWTTNFGTAMRTLSTLMSAGALATRAATLVAVGLQRAYMSVAAALGGPVGIALTAVTVATVFLSTRTDEAANAAERFKQRQVELAERLGKTSEAFMAAGAAAASYRLELAETDVAEARKKQREALGSLGGSLAQAANRLPIFAKGPNGLPVLNPEREQLIRMSQAATTGDNRSGVLNMRTLRTIRNNNPDAFQSSGFAGVFGGDPAKAGLYALGVKQTSIELGESERELARTRQRVNAPRPAPIDLSGPARQTKEQLQSRASLEATGGTAMADARDVYNAKKADLDAKFDAARAKGDYSFDKTYVTELAKAESAMNAVGDSQRAAAASARENRKAIAEQKREVAAQNKELREAEVRANKLADIQSRYTEEPTAVKRGNRDKDAIDDLFVQIKDGKRTVLNEIKIGDAMFSQADAADLKQRIDDSVRKPINDTIRDQRRELDVSKLILAGRENEAELLREKVRLVDAVGNILPEEEAALARNAARQRDINQQIEQRNRLVDVQARVAGNLQGNVRDLLAAPFDPKNIQSVAERMVKQFQESIADKLALTLFGGDAEQQARDAMTRGLNDSAKNLTSSAGDMSSAATDITTASAALERAAGVLAAPESLITSSALAPMNFNPIAGQLDGIMGTFEDAIDEILVVGRRPEPKPMPGPVKDPTKMTIEERTNNDATALATKLFGARSPLTKAAGQLGTILSGAQYAPVGMAAFSEVTGKKANAASAMVGGGLGKALLGQKGGLLEKGLTSIMPQLGQFAGPLGSIAGSILGSVVGDVLGIGRKKTRSGYASISTDAKGNAASMAAGGKRSEDRIAQAITYADDVLSSLSGIAKRFGGGLAGNLNLGTIGTQNDKFVFDADGSGRGAGIKVDTQEEAMRLAIRNAIDKGVITGIRAGTQRLLQAGKDLDAAIDKAFAFENVFTELKRYKDPTGAAIDALNKEFTRLIDIFNEAGASSQEFADLEELYGLRRADAIKDATNATVDNLQAFIDSLTSSGDSPLGRRTAYENAGKTLDAFRADLAAGKVVDSDKLIEALTNRQDTSANLNGSRSAFFNDFDDIIALAKSAQVNLSSPKGNLPASPFDPAVAGDIKNTASGVQQLNTTIANGLNAVVSAVKAQNVGSTSYEGSTFGLLPSALRR